VPLQDPDHGVDVSKLEPARDHDPDRRSLVAQTAQRAHGEVPRRNRELAAKLMQRGVRRFRIAEARPNQVHALSLCRSWAARRYEVG
jgi:hypothetical protein